MNASSISVDSNVLETIITNVNSDKTSIGEVKSSLESGFKALTDAGLFESCLKDLKDESSNIEKAYEILVTELKSHVDEYNSLEQQLANVADNYRSYYNPSTNNSNSYYTTDNSNTVTDVDTGTPVDPEKMETKFEKIDFQAIDEMLNFISIVKDNNKSFGDILADADNANYFCTLLQNYFKTYKSTLVEYDSSTAVQQILLRQLLNSGEDIPKALSENSILKFKKYLYKVAKDNNTNVYDLTVDEKYKDVFKQSLEDLYDNKVESSEFDDKYSKEFKQFIDSRAIQKKTNKEELFEDVKLLL